MGSELARDRVDEGFFGSGVTLKSNSTKIEEGQTQLLQDEELAFVSVSDQRTPVKLRKAGSKVSTVVCNHVGFHEIFNLILSPFCPAYTPKIELKNAPLVGTLC